MSELKTRQDFIGKFGAFTMYSADKEAANVVKKALDQFLSTKDGKQILDAARKLEPGRKLKVFVNGFYRPDPDPNHHGGFLFVTRCEGDDKHEFSAAKTKYYPVNHVLSINLTQIKPLLYKGIDNKYHQMSLNRAIAHEMYHVSDGEFGHIQGKKSNQPDDVREEQAERRARDFENMFMRKYYPSRKEIDRADHGSREKKDAELKFYDKLGGVDPRNLPKNLVQPPSHIVS